MAKDNSEGKQWILKLLVLGDIAVGKTSLINQYISASFKENYHPTLGTNILSKNIILEKTQLKVKLILWDIAGQDRYSLTRSMYYEGCSGALFVYDVTRKSTFEHITQNWLADYEKFGRNKEGVYLLIGNKIDLKESRNVSTEDGENLAREIRAADFVETSAKYGENVEIAFIRLVEKVLSNLGVKID